MGALTARILWQAKLANIFELIYNVTKEVRFLLIKPHLCIFMESLAGVGAVQKHLAAIKHDCLTESA